MELETQCPICNNLLKFFVDVTSDNLPDKVGTECQCGAIPVFAVNCWVEAELTQYLGDERKQRQTTSEAQ